MAFAHDVIAAGRNIRVLSVVDTLTRECLALEVDTGFQPARVLDEPGAAVRRRSQPIQAIAKPASGTDTGYRASSRTSIPETVALLTMGSKVRLSLPWGDGLMWSKVFVRTWRLPASL